MPGSLPLSSEYRSNELVSRLSRLGRIISLDLKLPHLAGHCRRRFNNPAGKRPLRIENRGKRSIFGPSGRLCVKFEALAPPFFSRLNRPGCHLLHRFAERGVHLTHHLYERIVCPVEHLAKRATSPHIVCHGKPPCCVLIFACIGADLVDK